MEEYRNTFTLQATIVPAAPLCALSLLAGPRFFAGKPHGNRVFHEACSIDMATRKCYVFWPLRETDIPEAEVFRLSDKVCIWCKKRELRPHSCAPNIYSSQLSTVLQLSMGCACALDTSSYWVPSKAF